MVTHALNRGVIALPAGEWLGGLVRRMAAGSEPALAPLWREMLARTRIKRNLRVLDAGCGEGGAAALAARAGADVLGIDSSPELVDAARERLPDGAFRVGDVLDMPYPDESFHVTLAADAVQNAAAPVTTLRELRRVTGARGKIAFGIWGAPQHCDQIDVLMAIRPAVPGPLAGLDPYEMSQLGALGRLLAAADLHVVYVSEVETVARYPDLESAWQAQLATRQVQAAIAHAGRAPVRAAVMAALAPYRTLTGGVRLRNRLRCVIAER